MNKKISINNGSTVPQSFITKNKQRVKQYVDTVYLENGDEFEIELFNPTQNKVLARIELNGVSIGSGIILRPGERVFLERYLNEPKKFKYETYFVDGNDASVESAIQRNGDVTISFYNELITNPTYLYNPTSFTTLNYTGNCNGTDTVTPTFNTNSNGTSIVNYNSTLSFSSPEVRSASLNTRGFTPKLKKETGRVEKGGNSSQTFTYDSTQFSTTKFASNWWKILPMSEKVKTIDEVQTYYCSSCGTKRKKDSYKFCPNCGTRYEEKVESKIIFTDAVNYVHCVDGEYKQLLMSSYNDTLDKFLERHKDKSKIIIKRDSLTENSLRAIVID
jgi:hypothetical protein